MSDAMRVEETVPGYHIVYVPNANQLSVRAPGGSSKSLGRVWSTGELWGWESADGTRGGLESTRECAMRSLEIEARA